MTQQSSPFMSTTNSGSIGLLASGAFCISLAAPLVKGSQVDPIIAAVFRMFFGGLMLALLMSLSPQWRTGWRQGWWGSALIAIFFSLDLWFWHKSIHWIGPGLATLLANFQVFLLPAAAGLIFKEHPQARFYWGLAVAALGLWLLFGVGWEAFTLENRWGVLYGLLTALAYAAYILTLRQYQSRPQAPATAARLFQVCVWCTFFLALSSWEQRDEYLTIALTDWLKLIALGVVCQVLGWLLITRGLPGVAAAVAGLILLLQPSLSLIWDFIFFDLALARNQLIGVALALGGIYLGSRGAKKAR